MRPRIIFLLFLFNVLITSAFAQNYYMPDSTAYEYFTHGNNLSQWVASPLTRVKFNSNISYLGRRSVEWVIPANSGTVSLKLKIGDRDLRNKVIYMVCKHKSSTQLIRVYAVASTGGKFKIGNTITTGQDFCLPETEWQQSGVNLSFSASNNADTADLAHVNYISFETSNSNQDLNIYIGEIRMTDPRGPVCVINFNRYRDLADTLLTPYLLQKGLTANIDFNYLFAKTQKLEHYSVTTFYDCSLGRIDTLVHQHNFSCSSHGQFYDSLPYLNLAERQQLYGLDSFITAGFDAHWILSIPKDIITPAALNEVMNLNRFFAIRKQGYDYNELPIEYPYRLGYFRPTSAIAGPNLNGTPMTIAQMKAYVRNAHQHKGLIILDFGTIVTDTSSLYTDVETTMQSDAYSLIDYAADSLHLTMLNFKQLFGADSSYVPYVTLADDYVSLKSKDEVRVGVLDNDQGPNLIISNVSASQHGTTRISANGKSIFYRPGPGCWQADTVVYVAGNGVHQDSATVILRRSELRLDATRSFSCNVNQYQVTANAFGISPMVSYAWSNGASGSTVQLNGSATYTVIVTDKTGCTLTDSLTLPNRVASPPAVFSTTQCNPGQPLCNAYSTGILLWYDSLSGGTLLQTGGNTLTSTTISSTTTYYVAAFYNPCVSTRVPVTATVAKPSNYITTLDDTFPCGNHNVELDCISDAGVLYQWYKNGVALTNNLSQSHYYNAYGSGAYYVSVTRPSDNCTSLSNSITVTRTGLPCKMTPWREEDLADENTLIVQGVFKAQPNPSEDAIRISSDTNLPIDYVEVYNSIGQMKGFYTPEVAGSAGITLQRNQLPAGLYICRIHSGSAVHTVRIVYK